MLTEIDVLKYALNLDAAETAILSQQLEYLKSQTYDIKYPALKALDFIPMDASVPAGADTIAYAQWDAFGMAKVISNYADDLPRVDVIARKFTSTVQSLGDSYTFSIQDLRAALMAGINLDARRAQMARRAIEIAMDEIAAFGLPEARLNGFLNHPNVTVLTAPNGGWSAATSADDMLEDLNYLTDAIVVNTKQIHKPDTLILDSQSFSLASKKYFGAGAPDKSVLRVFLDTNPYIRNIDQWWRLDTADADGTGPRVVAYERTNEVLEMAIPVMFEQLPAQPENLAFKVPCHARMGGVVIRYPLAIAYLDGL